MPAEREEGVGSVRERLALEALICRLVPWILPTVSKQPTGFPPKIRETQLYL